MNTVNKKAFILIDYSNDLIADDGVITCGKPAQAIAPVACKYMDEFLANGDFVVLANDVHDAPDANNNLDPYHPESSLFPPHNIAGTYGAELYGSIKTKWEEISKTNPFETAYFTKMRFSAFVGTKLDIWLRSRQVNHLYLGGVCTDMCVLHTAIDARNHGYEVSIVEAATCSGDQNNYEFAINHCKNLLGVHIV